MWSNIDYIPTTTYWGNEMNTNQSTANQEEPDELTEEEQAEREVVLRRLRELLDESRGTFARKSLHLAPKCFQKLTECVTFVRNAGIFFLQNSLNHSRRFQKCFQQFDIYFLTGNSYRRLPYVTDNLIRCREKPDIIYPCAVRCGV